MIIALFIIIAAVVSTPIAATVVVTMASRREEAACSLGGPARGTVQAAARQLLDFHSDDRAWPLPNNGGQAGPTSPTVMAERSVGRPRVRVVTDTSRPTATSKVSVGTAA